MCSPNWEKGQIERLAMMERGKHVGANLCVRPIGKKGNRAIGDDGKGQTRRGEPMCSPNWENGQIGKGGKHVGLPVQFAP